MIGANMFAYCNNNPVRFMDPSGGDPVTVLETWLGTAWWLASADGPLPIGEAVYCGTAVVLCVVAVFEPICNYLGSADEPLDASLSASDYLEPQAEPIENEATINTLIVSIRKELVRARKINIKREIRAEREIIAVKKGINVAA